MAEILFIADRLSARGGADRHLIGILDHLQGRVDTCLAVGHEDGSLSLAGRARLGPWQRVKGLDRSGLSERGRAAARKNLARVIQEAAPGYVFVQNLMDPALISQALAAAPGAVLVQDHRVFCPGLGKLTSFGEPCSRVLGPGCLACFADPDYGARMLAVTLARLQALAGASLVLVLSGYMAAELEAAWQAHGITPPPLRVWPPMVHGLEDAPPRQGPGEYHLLAGRLVKRKGVLIALEAARLLKEPLPLVVAGDGSLRDEVTRQAKEHPKRIQYAGWAGRAEMGRLLGGARSLWLPSLWAEPFGIAGLEAISLGAPVIAPLSGGTGAWLRPGQNGLAVAAGDAHELARAADSLAADPGLALQMGQSGARLAAGDYDPGGLTKRLLAWLDGITV